MRIGKDGLFKRIIEAAVAQSWRVEPTSKSHMKLLPPDRTKEIVTVAGSPSDHRAVKNTLSMMRRSGLVFENG